MKPRTIIIRGKPVEIVEHAQGYARSGESMHTRLASRGAINRAQVSVDTPADLLKRLRRAKARHGNHRDPVVRRRAGEDMRELQGMLRRLGYVL
jgi:hypothetical protein